MGLARLLSLRCLARTGFYQAMAISKQVIATPIPLVLLAGHHLVAYFTDLGAGQSVDH
jgi:hypothetical protein